MKKYEEFFLKNKPQFLFGAVKKEQFLKTHIPEIAFIGKSNVGKSSLINAIANTKIAKTSKTPGRTRELNFFNIANKINFVDMPGYGFALVTEAERQKWHNFIYDYLSSSENLKRIFLLIDARRGLNINDFEFMQILDETLINYQIILTKVDERKIFEVEEMIKQIENEMQNHKTAEKEVLFSSSKKLHGIDKVKETIYNLIVDKYIKI